MFREALIILAFSLLAAVGTHYFHPKAPAWYLNADPVRDDEVSLDDINGRWRGDVLWIDARPRSQYEAGHVPGALLINESLAEARRLGWERVMLVGDAPYYSRFGFQKLQGVVMPPPT